MEASRCRGKRETLGEGKNSLKQIYFDNSVDEFKDQPKQIYFVAPDEAWFKESPLPAEQTV